MSDKVAEKDITVENVIGQRVVLVPAGQPIPEDLDLRKKQVAGNVPVKQAEEKAEPKAEPKPKSKPKK